MASSPPIQHLVECQRQLEYLKIIREKPRNLENSTRQDTTLDRGLGRVSPTTNNRFRNNLPIRHDQGVECLRDLHQRHSNFKMMSSSSHSTRDCHALSLRTTTTSTSSSMKTLTLKKRRASLRTFQTKTPPSTVPRV